MGSSHVRTGLPEVDGQKWPRSVVDPDQRVAPNLFKGSFDSLSFAGMASRSSVDQPWWVREFGRQGGCQVFILRAGHDDDPGGLAEVGGRLQWVPEEGPTVHLRVDLVAVRTAGTGTASTGENY